LFFSEEANILNDFNEIFCFHWMGTQNFKRWWATFQLQSLTNLQPGHPTANVKEGELWDDLKTRLSGDIKELLPGVKEVVDQTSNSITEINQNSIQPMLSRFKSNLSSGWSSFVNSVTKVTTADQVLPKVNVSEQKQVNAVDTIAPQSVQKVPVADKISDQKELEIEFIIDDEEDK